MASKKKSRSAGAAISRALSGIERAQKELQLHIKELKSAMPKGVHGTHGGALGTHGTHGGALGTHGTHGGGPFSPHGIHPAAGPRKKKH